MAMLDKGASGSMHLQWGKSIAATLNAHGRYNYLLNEKARALIAKEQADLVQLLTTLGISVGAYRAFVEGAFIDVRAGERVADFLVDVAQTQAKATVTPVKAEVDAVLNGGAVSIWAGKPLSRILAAGRRATIQYAQLAAAKIRSLPAKDVFSFKDTIAAVLEKAGGLLEQLVDEESGTIEPKRLPLRTKVEGDVFALRDFLTKMNGRLIQELDQAFVDSLYPVLRRDNQALAEPIDEEVDASAPAPTPTEPTA